MIRETLDKRRNLEADILAIERQIERDMLDGAPGGYSSGWRVEKVPGKDEYVLRVGRTNNPEGAAMQREDGYRERLEQLRREKLGLMDEVERIIAGLDDAVARAILRYYYCQAWTDDRIRVWLKAAILRSRPVMRSTTKLSKTPCWA